MRPTVERDQAQNGRCPRCGSADVLTIVYGLVEPGMFAGRRVDLGGCCVASDSPAWRCQDYSHAWGRTRL